MASVRFEPSVCQHQHHTLLGLTEARSRTLDIRCFRRIILTGHTVFKENAMSAKHGAETIPSLWDAAKQEMDEYRFLGDVAQEKWNIPKTIGISCAVAERFAENASHGHSSVSIAQYVDSASAVIEEGAYSIHIDFTWVTDEKGRRLDKIPSVEAYPMVLEPLRKRHGNSFLADLNVLNGSTFDECMAPIVSGLADMAPCAAGHPAAFLIPALRTMEKYGVKPQIGIHNSGEIELAKRRIIDAGVAKGPFHWGILYGLPFDVGRTLLSGTAVLDADDMIRQLLLMVHQIRKLDPQGQITVCAAGRATLYMTTLATIMGLNIRVGTEDTAWKYPNSDERFTDNVEMFKMAKEIAALHGRRTATAKEMREVFGMSR